jgi:hypothetical protein
MKLYPFCRYSYQDSRSIASYWPSLQELLFVLKISTLIGNQNIGCSLRVGSRVCISYINTLEEPGV